MAILRDADLSEADLSRADLRDANLSGADLRDADLSEADLERADLRDAVLTETTLTGAGLVQTTVTDAQLADAQFEYKIPTDEVSPADIVAEAGLSEANLSGADLTGADLSEAYLMRANLSGADLSGAGLPRANLDNADLSEAHLRGVDLSGANLERADLSRANLSYADLSDANLERATIVEVNLFDAALTKVTPYGARIEAVQINDGTEFYEGTKGYSSWWQREEGFLAAPPRCGYDPAVEKPEQATNTDRETRLTRAADTCRQFEKLARQNTQPSLQSSMFVLRQNMQRERYRERGSYIQWGANRLFRIVFKHGESFARVLLTAAVIILAFAAGYWQADLIIDNPDAPQSEQEFIGNPLDAVYFSTLTFTTLGLGDFQPTAASQLGRALVLLQAVLGAILIATFVFVLGRRAAR